MRARVVFESMFGNTQMIAEAIADGIAGKLEVEIQEVGAASAEMPGDLALLVVGGPTHAHGMTRPATRKSPDVSKRTGGPVSTGLGIREWVPAVSPPRGKIAAATFDTRFDKPSWLTGSAARGAAKALRRRGFAMITEPQSFFVSGTSGPLAEGEIERAHAWGAMLASTLVEAGQPVSWRAG
jgi:hypothetical protein